jgi:hypothetical protein
VRHPGRALLLLLALPDAPRSRRLPSWSSLLLLLLSPASPKVRSLASPYHLLSSRHWARIPRVCCCWKSVPFVAGPLGVDWTVSSSLHARTTRSRSNLRLACNSRITCSSSVASHFDLRPLRRCHLTNSLAVRARPQLRLTSIDGLTDSFSAASVVPFCL